MVEVLAVCPSLLVEIHFEHPCPARGLPPLHASTGRRHHYTRVWMATAYRSGR